MAYSRRFYVFAAFWTLFWVLAFVYAVSPFFASVGLMKAFASGDSVELESRINFPRVRQSVKEQISATMLRGTATSEADADATMLAATFGSVIANAAVDTMLTPAGLSAIIKSRTQGDLSERNFNIGVIDNAFFDSPVQFSFDVRGFHFVLRFSGTGWKLVDLIVPEDQ